MYNAPILIPFCFWSNNRKELLFQIHFNKIQYVFIACVIHLVEMKNVRKYFDKIEIVERLIKKYFFRFYFKQIISFVKTKTKYQTITYRLTIVFKSKWTKKKGKKRKNAKKIRANNRIDGDHRQLIRKKRKENEKSRKEDEWTNTL